MPDVETGLTVDITGDVNNPASVLAAIENRSKYLMHYGMQMFFANGGGPCWIVSVGDYTTKLVDFDLLIAGLNATEKVDEITLYVYPRCPGYRSFGKFL